MKTNRMTARWTSHCGVGAWLACLLAAGCAGPSGDEDALGVYESVFRSELEARDTGNGEAYYLQLNGQDPPAPVLDRLREKWPALRAGSQMPTGKRNLLHAEDARWIDGSTAEVRGGFNNGTDGSIHRYRLVRRSGLWVVEKKTTEALS